MHRTLTLGALLTLSACGGALGAGVDAPPAHDAGTTLGGDDDASSISPDAGHHADADVDASTSTDASAADVEWWDASVDTACRVELGSPASAAYTTSAAVARISGAEIPFPLFTCGAAASGDVYETMIQLAPGSSEAYVYLDEASTGTSVSSGTCASSLLLDGAPATADDLRKAPAGSRVALAVFDCTYQGNPSVPIVRAWIDARFSSPK